MGDAYLRQIMETSPAPHPTNTREYRPTPDISRSRAPTVSEIEYYETGSTRFPGMSLSGSFRVWPLEELFPGIIIQDWNFNCFGWSLGHTDRWIDGGTVEEMNRLYTQYHFVQCQQSEAEVELYRISDAPPQLQTPRGRVYDNRRAIARHAHRRDYPQLDGPPGLGCSSKLGDGHFIAHNRMALEDTRPDNATQPRVEYGSIYQYWRRTPEHPSFPGKEHNLQDRGHYFHDPVFFDGRGTYPHGHPGNTICLPGQGQGSSQGVRTSQASPGLAQQYARVSTMNAHDAIPGPGQAARESAAGLYKSILKSCPNLVMEFEMRFSAWQATWYSDTTSPGSSAQARCDVAEFERLLEMGTTIIPLVVYKLLDPYNFTAVFLYNALERDKRYLVNPRDVLNFLVLQRQNNLIIDLNQGRKWS
ncbi:hypothetical protein F5Y07DRAFT_77974 [Xylaria sp. FL0933]|nr:hypothetical protein F5Y07DRAFT_77974 [Xylaria sp. FL0933]